MVLVLTVPDSAGRTDINGTVGLIADLDNARAEYAFVLGHALTGLGLAPLMMRRIIDYVRERGTREVFGEGC